MYFLDKDSKKKFRYEQKYILTAGQILHLKNRLEGICFSDNYVLDNNTYKIRSVYFDDYNSSSYKDNEMGVDPRSKFRIRIYNCSHEQIVLEQKMKVSGKIYKERAFVDREFCELLLHDRGEEITYPNENPLINRFLLAYHTRLLRPNIIVEYEREPYVYPDGDVRITFDRNISFSDDIEHFFEENLFMRPIMPVGKELLEVKYTEFLPDFLHQGLDIKNLQRCTFSKYFLCEKLRKNGGNIL
ncbi:MAG: polyphosphate polymerase domain-containing protein [Lachnospiraceae bacterium]|nr:polyphosphate polymerase domain-containing protein [Lachnospiraceae bacterium]